MIRPPEYVSSIKPYVPGKPIEEVERELGITGSIKLASNENPLGPPKKAISAIEGSLAGLNRYPDGEGHYLKSALSERLDVKTDEIILGNGSNELIDIAVRTYMAPGDEAVMAAPSFIYYPISVKAMGGKAVEVPLMEMRHDLEAMAGAITDKTKIVFIANPNNPTGTINRKTEFDRFMGRVPEGVLVVVDEAYKEYVASEDYPDSLRHLRDGRDILILRTFSKIYGLAALRVGYGVANARITGEMNKIRLPFNTSSLGQIAARAALEDTEHVLLSLESNEAGKRYLYGALSSLGVDYVPTEANFIYMAVSDSGAIYEALLKEGVIVRPMGPKALRVTIGLPDENARFIEALRSVLSRA